MNTAQIIKSHPQILELWEEFKKTRNNFWTRLENINKKYEGKYHVALKNDDLGDVCGIEIRDMKHIVIHAFDLESISEEK